jgi:type VI protein secretion system component Hcp
VTYEDFMPEMHQRFQISQMNEQANEDADEAVTETDTLSLQYGQVTPNHQEDVGARYSNA